jgi:hypothetical protein
MAKNKFLGLVLLVLYAISLFLSFYFDLVAQYRNFFAVYFLVVPSFIWYLIYKK